jgi:hypothetical protein
VEVIASRAEDLRGPRRKVLPVTGAALGVCAVVTAAVVLLEGGMAHRRASPTAASSPPDDNHVGRLCQANDLRWALVWKANQLALEGELSATNTSGEDCDLLVKPQLTPLDRSNVPLKVLSLHPLELKIGPAVLANGATAVSQVTWAGWCGPQAGRFVRVSWPDGGSSDVTASGPSTPECPPGGQPMNLTSGWFSPLTRPRQPTRPLTGN